MNSERKIVLVMPGYGKQTEGAGRGFWKACRNMTGVWNEYQGGSLLASNFNSLWCLALNLVHTGERVDYFAMLHDDVAPDDFWLDALIEELEAKELDVLGVAVPIKDSRGLTSMALANGRYDQERKVWTDDISDGREYDLFRMRGRLTMHELYELPETFTSEDVGSPLLLNTGCWVAKWNQDWCKKVHFEIRDRIIFNKRKNRYQADTLPEDWFFSRQLHELGLKIGATRKIAIEHFGDAKYQNTHPWGSDKFDSESVDKSVLPSSHPWDITGWLLPEEGKALAELARGKRVLEIGSYFGLSTVCLARTAEHVTAVDYFDGRGTSVRIQPDECLREFKRNLSRHGVSDKVEICHPDEEFPLPEYDLAFIDGAHDVDSVRADIQKALAVLSADGLIAFHDYRIGIDKGVDAAVNEFIESGAVLVSQTKSLAVVKPPALIPLEV